MGMGHGVLGGLGLSRFGCVQLSLLKPPLLAVVASRGSSILRSELAADAQSVLRSEFRPHGAIMGALERDDRSTGTWELELFLSCRHKTA